MSDFKCPLFYHGPYCDTRCVDGHPPTPDQRERGEASVERDALVQVLGTMPVPYLFALGEVFGATRKEAETGEESVTVGEVADAMLALRAPAPSEAVGTWPARCEQRAFVAGAKWWEFVNEGATMFPSDVDRAEAEAVSRYGNPAPAREVTEAARTVLLAFHDWPEYRSDFADGERQRALAILTAALTPDAEGGA